MRQSCEAHCWPLVTLPLVSGCGQGPQCCPQRPAHLHTETHQWGPVGADPPGAPAPGHARRPELPQHCPAPCPPPPAALAVLCSVRGPAPTCSPAGFAELTGAAGVQCEVPPLVSGWLGLGGPLVSAPGRSPGSSPVEPSPTPRSDMWSGPVCCPQAPRLGSAWPAWGRGGCERWSTSLDPATTCQRRAHR